MTATLEYHADKWGHHFVGSQEVVDRLKAAAQRGPEYDAGLVGPWFGTPIYVDTCPCENGSERAPPEALETE